MSDLENQENTEFNELAETESEATETTETTETMAQIIARKAKEKEVENSKISKTEKLKKVDGVLNIIKKKHGKDSIQRMSGDKISDHPCFSTQIPTLDAATGIGGFPKGRISEVLGAESSGKTTLILLTIAEVQRCGGVAALIDAEHALDPKYAKKLGVDLDELLIAQPDNGEEALEITKSLIESGGVDFIAVDSVAALVPRAELEGDIGDSNMALHARLMGKAMRHLTAAVAKSNTCLVFINQIRSTMDKYRPTTGCVTPDTYIEISL
jgi:recombination protein RecA